MSSTTGYCATFRTRTIEPDLQDWAHEVRVRVEHRLERALPPARVMPERLHDAMRYSVLGGGKRMRALLAFGAGEVTGAPLAALDTVSAAIELIHAYSLVHDDLPCMDDDDLRRGKPACHKEFDEATALLVGDSLQSLAFQLVGEEFADIDSRVRIDMVRRLAVAIGSRGMAGGQALDIDSTDRSIALPELESMHIHKTGALIRASVALGALCGKQCDPGTLERLDAFARHIGLAFQVVDDVLDARGTTAALGKTAGKDARANKPTYVSIMGLEQASEFAEELCSRGVSALEPFADRARRLIQIADYVVNRHH